MPAIDSRRREMSQITKIKGAEKNTKKRGTVSWGRS